MVSVAPVLTAASGLHFSPLGFSNLLNGGGGVLSVHARGPGAGGAAREEAALARNILPASPALHGHHGGGAEAAAGGEEGGPFTSLGGWASMLSSDSAGPGPAPAEGPTEVALQLRGCGSFLAYADRPPRRCWLVAGGGDGEAAAQEEHARSGGREAAAFTYDGEDGRLLVQVPWSEASQGRVELVLEF